MAVITVPKTLREKLGEQGSNDLVMLINNSGQKEKEDIIEIAEERFESKLNIGLAKLDNKLSKEISESHNSLKSEFKQDMAEMDKKISAVQTNLIKWMVTLFVGQFFAIIGVLAAILFALKNL